MLPFLAIQRSRVRPSRPAPDSQDSAASHRPPLRSLHFLPRASRLALPRRFLLLLRPPAELPSSSPTKPIAVAIAIGITADGVVVSDHGSHHRPRPIPATRLCAPPISGTRVSRSMSVLQIRIRNAAGRRECAHDRNREDRDLRFSPLAAQECSSHRNSRNAAKDGCQPKRELRGLDAPHRIEVSGTGGTAPHGGSVALLLSSPPVEVCHSLNTGRHGHCPGNGQDRI